LFVGVKPTNTGLQLLVIAHGVCMQLFEAKRLLSDMNNIIPEHGAKYNQLSAQQRQPCTQGELFPRGCLPYGTCTGVLFFDATQGAL
jgi:hypothetical protein